MGRYIAKRLLNLLPVILGITLLVFAFLHLIPGDPAITMLGDRATPQQVEALRERMGLNQPLPLQYLKFLWDLIRLDFGTSIITGVPIAEEIRIRWPATFELSVAAMLVASILGIPAGVLAAVRKNSFVDNLTMSGSLLGVSLPVYWLGLLLIYFFAVNLDLVAIDFNDGLCIKVAAAVDNDVLPLVFFAVFVLVFFLSKYGCRQGQQSYSCYQYLS